MKKFIRDNPTIAFGLGLPMVLVVLFLAISGIPALLVPVAQYDVLYATNYNYYNNAQNTLQVVVVGDRVQVSYIGSNQPQQQSRLWRFNPKTGAVREIAVLLPSGLTASTGQPSDPPKPPVVTAIQVPDLANLKVDSSSLAPDGYQFSSSGDGYSARAFTGLFYSPRYGIAAELSKNGRSIRLPQPEGAYYGQSVRFIGWVVSP